MPMYQVLCWLSGRVSVAPPMFSLDGWVPSQSSRLHSHTVSHVPDCSHSAMLMPLVPAEYKAWKIYRSLDVEYVFVVFGGMVGYSSDDINKFLWMVRIGGGVYPEIKEQDYLSPEGENSEDL